MSEPKRGIALDGLADLSQMSVADLKALLDTKLPEYSNFSIGEFVLDAFGYDRPDFKGFSLSAALAIEVARQLADDGGIPLIAALKTVIYTGAVSLFPDDDIPPQELANNDFWVAVLGTRSDWWGESPRVGWPETAFGPSEVWLKSHYEGTFDHVTTAIKIRMADDAAGAMEGAADVDSSRVFMTNVSAAARRLRKRAHGMGLEIGPMVGRRI
jgi:hypothetical protein